MFGPKIRNVFKSRWQALFWSAGVLLTAYCSVPSPDEGGASPADEKAARKVAEMLGAKPDKSDRHVNPWAKDAN